MTFNTFIFGRAFHKSGDWSEKDIKKILAEARSNTAGIRQTPVDYILDVLSKTGNLFSDKSSPFRKQALFHLRETIPFSKPVIEKTLNIFCGLLDKEDLKKRIRLELSSPESALDGFMERREYAGTVAAVPKGVVLHVGAGNVFVGIIDSLILGLLTKNVNIVKVSSSGSNFPVMFARAVSKCDGKGILSRSMAVLTWKGGRTELEKTVLKGCDAAFIWGSDEAIAGYKKLSIPLKTHVVGFGTKMSAAVITETSLRNDSIESIARKAAYDAAQWDQSACSSPHTVYLVGAKYGLLKKFAHAAGRAFAEIQKQLPQGTLSDDEKVEITKARQLAKVDSAVGKAHVESSFPLPHWTVIAEKDHAFKISPLNRVIYVKSVSSISELKRVLGPYKGYIQTAGVSGSTEEKRKIALMLAPLGVARVTELGSMLSSITGSPHDGIFPMRELVNWTAVENHHPTRGRDSLKGEGLVIDSLRELVGSSRRDSPFYRKHFKNAPEVRTMEDFRKLPLLSKKHILAHTPPKSRKLFTAGIESSGIYFASGGSTGNPKYIFYDSGEYENVCRCLGLSMEAGGLKSRDVAANLFAAGNLWSSFLSVEKALAHTGAVSVPIGSALDMETILKYLAEFKTTVLIGLPSFLLKVAQSIQENKARYNIPVRRIFFGGEYVTPAMVKFFQKVFPGVLVKSAAYATADAGTIGFQCEKTSRGVHHLFDGEQFMEILDPKTLKPVGPGETGEIIITPLNKRRMPIIRYRLGDLGRWCIQKCPCGRKEPLFEILGRCDDRIHVGGAHVFINDLHNAVSEVPGLSFNFQVVIAKKGPRDALKISVEARGPVRNAQSLKKRLLGSIRKNCHDLAADALDRGLISNPEIEILPPNSIKRVARTGKLKRVIDKRI